MRVISSLRCIEHTTKYLLGVQCFFRLPFTNEIHFRLLFTASNLVSRRREFGGCKSPFSRLPCCYSRTQHKAAPCFLPSHNKNTDTHESSVLVLTSQAHYPQCPTGSEIRRICPPQTRGRKIDREFIFSIFIRERHEDLIKQIKKSVIYTLTITRKRLRNGTFFKSKSFIKELTTFYCDE